MKLRSSLLLLLFLLLVQSALAQGRYQVGQRVDIDIIMAGAPERAIWQTGTIVRIQDGNYILKMDDGQTRQMPIAVEAKWVRAGTGAAPAAAAPPAANPAVGGPVQVGQRVEVDIIMAGAPERSMWQAGTLLRIEGNDYIVRTDDGQMRNIPIRNDNRWIRPGGGAAPANPPVAATPPATPPRTNPPADPPKAATPPANQAQAGQGAPPDGVYNCHKISGGTLMGLGKLEIRGGTYRGMAGGAFHSYTVGGDGNITWSAGLTGMPDGWTLLASTYCGLDYRGRPLIKISYRSSSGWNDLIDAVRE